MKHNFSLPFGILFVIVIANYVAQIPYDLHLYHGTFNAFGGMLLLVTLLWFFAGFFLLRKGKRIGFWLLLSFLSFEFLFYGMNTLVLSFFGYGLPYELFRVKDIIVKMVFMVGDINFLAAGYYIYYLLKRKSFLLKS